MKNYLFISFIIAMCFVSCVPKKQLVNEQNRVKQLQRDSTSTHSSLTDCDSKLDACNSKVDEMEKEKAEIQKELENVSSTSQSELSKSQSELSKTKMTIAEQAKRLADLQNLIRAQKDAVNKLRKTVADALINFKPDELTVSIKDGDLYVSMQEKLLFKSGSAVVDPKGVEALQKLATALNTAPDINIMVEGHTDTVPIHGKYEDNWALSVARATSVVRLLTVNDGMNPHRVTAAGRSKFFPVASNDTPEGRQKNRRTDIIISPDLAPLYKLLGQ